MSNVRNTFDFLVIGSGIAGLTTALKLAEAGSVAIVTKKEDRASATNYAQGGIATVLSPLDDFESHLDDTLTAGAGLFEMMEVLGKEESFRRIAGCRSMGTFWG